MIQGAKLKLIYVITQAELGGAQRYVFDLASNFKDEFDVVVVTGQGRSKELLEKCSAIGMRTHELKHLVREINPIKDIAATFELANFFKQEKPDIIHLNSSKTSFIGALAHVKCQMSNVKCRFIYTAHGWVFNEPLPWWKKKLYLLTERMACKMHDKIIVLSQYDFSAATQNKICDQKKLTIIPHGIKPIDFLPRDIARQKLTTNYKLQTTNSVCIITIANLYKTKGIKYLIEAAALLKKGGLGLNFIIIGDGPERKNYELRVASYGLQDFHFLGSIPDAARYLKAFDIFALPSVKEGMPYALLEAMQAGLPIIATSVGAIQEIIENKKTGLLVAPKDAPTLAEALASLITDHELREILSKNAADRFSPRYVMNHMIEKTSNLYRMS